MAGDGVVEALAGTEVLGIGVALVVAADAVELPTVTVRVDVNATMT